MALTGLRWVPGQVGAGPLESAGLCLPQCPPQNVSPARPPLPQDRDKLPGTYSILKRLYFFNETDPHVFYA